MRAAGKKSQEHVEKVDSSPSFFLQQENEIKLIKIFITISFHKKHTLHVKLRFTLLKRGMKDISAKLAAL